MSIQYEIKLNENEKKPYLMNKGLIQMYMKLNEICLVKLENI